MQLDLKALCSFPLFAALTLLGLVGAIMTDTTVLLLTVLAVLIGFQVNLLVALIVFFGGYLVLQSLGNIANALLIHR